MAIVPDIACLREPNLLVPGRKPVGTVRVNWGHTLSYGLELCIIWNSTPTDIVNQHSISFSGAVPDASGLQIVGTDKVTITTMPALPNGHTVVHIFTPFALDSAGYLSDHGDANELAIINGYQVGYFNCYGSPYPVNNDPTLTQMPISSVGEPNAVAYSRDSSNRLLGAVDGTVYVNAIANNGDVIPSAGMSIGQPFASTAAPANGVFDMTIVYARPLSAAELELITTNPYQILEAV